MESDRDPTPGEIIAMCRELRGHTGVSYDKGVTVELTTHIRVNQIRRDVHGLVKGRVVEGIVDPDPYTDGTLIVRADNQRLVFVRPREYRIVSNFVSRCTA